MIQIQNTLFSFTDDNAGDNLGRDFGTTQSILTNTLAPIFGTGASAKY
jgi:hypothetical protein